MEFDDLSNRVIGCAILTYIKLAKVKIGLLMNFKVPKLKEGIKRFVL